MREATLRRVEQSCQTGEARHGRRSGRCRTRRTPVLDRLPMRDENGEIRREFVRANHARRSMQPIRVLLREIVAELHEADLGDLIERA